ncbi:MAG: STAS domain-containing protein [Candidatus Kapabacteria bacterium]|jgi:anti-anti-sigma factor|nr:STAS domain-containing protein [Candidatus Kapabacteria bacterium]
MNLKFENVEDVLVVYVNELKFTNLSASDFRDRMQNKINEGATKVLINLEKVNYMDSAALGSIIAVYNHLNSFADSNELSPKFAICSLNKSVDFLFSMLRINGIIGLYENQEMAIIKMK